MIVARAALVERGHVTPRGKRRRVAPKPAPDIPFQDERDLLWRFGARWILALDCASNFSAMVEKLNLYALRGRPCLRCGGVNESRDQHGNVLVQELGGSGYVRDSKAFREWLRIAKLCKRPTDRAAAESWLRQHNRAFAEDRHAKCTTCRGTGRTGDQVCGRCQGSTFQRSYLDHGDHQCQECAGFGWKFDRRVGAHKSSEESEPTVNFTGEQGAKKKNDLDGSDELFKYARLNRRLAAVRDIDPVAHDGFAIYYSPDGQDASSLWELTRTGRLLLRDKVQGISDEQFFQTLRLVQESNQDKRRAMQFARANQEAEQILERMKAAWWESGLG